VPDQNTRIVLAQRPVGYPKPKDFKIVRSQIPDPVEGEFLLKTCYLSVDPYQRGRMNEGASYAPGVSLGEVMTGGIVGEVVRTNHADYQEGDVVQANLGWQEYAISDGTGARKVDPTLAPISTSLGVLGMPGATAYFGLLEIGKPLWGETVLVSGAAGAVGSLVGQIAKIKGCRAVGIAGSNEKVEYIINELGFDDGYNYKTTSDHGEALKSCCPEGVDVYFDNVGGVITDAVFPRLNEKGRISICGQISQYNLEDPEQGPRHLWHLIVKRLRVQGFLVFDFADRYAEALTQMAAWIGEGKLKYREDIVEGIENAPAAFIGMLSGDNIGKRLIKVA
jgi:NADPH-dependent curcumin reductase CurA